MHLLILERNQAVTSTLEQTMVRFICLLCSKFTDDQVKLVQRLKVINRLSRQQWVNEQPSHPHQMDTDPIY